MQLRKGPLPLHLRFAKYGLTYKMAVALGVAYQPKNPKLKFKPEPKPTWKPRLGPRPGGRGKR